MSVCIDNLKILETFLKNICVNGLVNVTELN